MNKSTAIFFGVFNTRCVLHTFSTDHEMDIFGTTHFKGV